MQNNEIGKKTKSTGLWASRLIRYNWEMINSIWECRNKKNNELERKNDLHGYQILKESVKKEWRAGLGTLPSSEFSHFFSTSTKKAINKSTECMKDWFCVI
jgi:hypothetical protein